MSRLTVKKTTGGTAFELQRRTSSHDIWLDVLSGGIHDLPEARIVNTTVPGAVGLAPDGLPVDESMLIRLKGYVAGVGATAAARRAVFRTDMTALRTQLVGAGTLITIVAYPPNEGLVSAETATVVAQLQRIMPGPAMGWEYQELLIEALCISDPVGWSIA